MQLSFYKLIYLKQLVNQFILDIFMTNYCETYLDTLKTISLCPRTDSRQYSEDFFMYRKV